MDNLIEQDLIDTQDAKEVSLHPVDEACLVKLDSSLDLKELLSESFHSQVQSTLQASGMIVEQEWHVGNRTKGRIVFSGPWLLIRGALNQADSSKVHVGEAAVQDAFKIAKELAGTLVALIDERVRPDIKVWAEPPRLDRWNSQWVFEVALVAAEKRLLEDIESDEDSEDSKEVSGTGVAPDFAMPPADLLSHEGREAWRIIVGVLADENARSSGGQKVFHSPGAWEAREEEYGTDSELIVVHDGGDHAPFFNLDYEGYLLHAKMDLALRRAGLYAETMTNWYSAIYKTPPNEEQLARLEQWIKDKETDPAQPVAESEEEDDLDTKEIAEPGGTKDERLRQILTLMGLHIKSMEEVPADPGWGTLGQPKRIIVTLLQNDVARPWTSNGVAVPEFSDFLRRGLSNIGEVLDTTDVDYSTRFLDEMGAWEITWFVGDPDVKERRVSEAFEDDGATEPVDCPGVVEVLLAEEEDGACPKEIEKAADAVEEDPTDAQKEAGNYKKGHVVISGLDISIENPKGGERSGKDKDGKEWKVTLPAHYGYIKGTEGKDKDHIDVFIGQEPDSEKVFVVNQNKLEGGFDEHKCMICFDDRDTAIAAYDKAYSGDLGPKLRDSVVTTTMEKFKAWLEDGDHKHPFKEVELKESVSVTEVLAHLESIRPKMDEARDLAAEQEPDPKLKESILKGHGTYKGSCGHRIQGCRCPSQFGCSVIQVEALCYECARNPVQQLEKLSGEFRRTKNGLVIYEGLVGRKRSTWNTG